VIDPDAIFDLLWEHWAYVLGAFVVAGFVAWSYRGSPL